MARQKYSDEQIDFINNLLDNSELTKAEIADKFLKEFEESGRKIDNVKQKITKVATEKGIDLKERVRAEPRSSLGNSKMNPSNTLTGAPISLDVCPHKLTVVPL